MVRVNPPPPPEELEKRRKVKFIIDPTTVKKQEEQRLRQWALRVMQNNEHRLDKKTPNMHVVWSDVVSPEDIDIQQMYPHKELNWVIYRENQFWSLMLRSKEKLLAKFQYARLDTI